QSATDWALHRERVQQLYAQTPHQTAAGFIAIAALFLLDSYVDVATLGAWSAIIGVIQLGRIALWLCYRYSFLRLSQSRWEWLFLASTLFSATMIGASVSSILVRVDPMGQL